MVWNSIQSPNTLRGVCNPTATQCNMCYLEPWNAVLLDIPIEIIQVRLQTTLSQFNFLD